MRVQCILLCSRLNDINVFAAYWVANFNHSLTIGFMINRRTATFYTQAPKIVSTHANADGKNIVVVIIIGIISCFWCLSKIKAVVMVCLPVPFIRHDQSNCKRKRKMIRNWLYPAIKLANSGCEFPWTMTTSDDGNDSIVLDFTRFTGRKLPKLKWWQPNEEVEKK